MSKWFSHLQWINLFGQNVTTMVQVYTYIGYTLHVLQHLYQWTDQCVRRRFLILWNAQPTMCEGDSLNGTFRPFQHKCDGYRLLRWKSTGYGYSIPSKYDSLSHYNVTCIIFGASLSEPHSSVSTTGISPVLINTYRWWHVWVFVVTFPAPNPSRAGSGV